jgi:hypothetical protein
MVWTWFKSTSSGMQDVSASVAHVGPGDVALAGVNGTIWRLTSWNQFRRDNASGFRRMAMSPNGTSLWGVSTEGALWYSTQPDIWKRLEATDKLRSPVEDAVVNYDNSLWVTLKNGQMWSIRNGVDWEWRTVLGLFKRLAVGPNNQWWGIDTQGFLWSRDGNHDPGEWFATNGSGMEDVSAGEDGTVWLVGTNGSVWTTRDGQSFVQVTASGFRSVSAQANWAWFVGADGALWVYQNVTTPPSTPPNTPPSTPPATSPMGLLHLRIENQAPAHFSVSGVGWRVWRQELNGVTLLQSINQASADVHLPANGQYHVHADVWAVRRSTGDNELAEFRGNGASIDGIPTLVLVWNGSSQTKTFRLVAEGQAGGVVNPVVQFSGGISAILRERVAGILQRLVDLLRGRAVLQRPKSLRWGRPVRNRGEYVSALARRRTRSR